MIQVRLLNDTDLIEFVESTPDTVISLSTGKKLMVKQSVDEIVDAIIEFRRRVGVADGSFYRRRADGEHTERSA